MLVFPNCKINLGLHILSKREDHYHNIETVFLPLSLCDILEVVAQENENKVSSFLMSGLPIEMNEQENLCNKALQILKKDFPSIPSVTTHVFKNIPVGAGLGGGSADGAFMLVLLNEKFQLGLSSEKLGGYALSLGSDCPFFIRNKPVVASSRGEILKDISLDLSRFHFVLVYPGMHISTAWSFSQVIPKKRNHSLQEIIQLPVSSWKEKLQNDFEEPVFKKYLQVKEVKEYLYANGAVYAAMSGSGSSVFAMFENIPPTFSFPSNYIVFNRLKQLAG